MVRMSGFEPPRIQGLSLFTLPVGVHTHGASGRIRTFTLQGLSLLSLPVAHTDALIFWK